MRDTILWYAWEMFTLSEANAWWLMMCVLTLTLITFIYQNNKRENKINLLLKANNIPFDDESVLTKIKKRILTWKNITGK
tara:strand:- start:12728 stop:12967 length:240 start_codon:yes stop_codon:yes gene_type:complete